MFAAALAASAFVAPILIALWTSVPGTVQTPLAEALDNESGLPIEIRGNASVEMDGTFFVHKTQLTTKDAARLTAHQHIRLLVISFRTKPDLEDAELQVTGTRCVYRTKAGTRFPDDGPLTFARGPGCAPIEGQPTGQIAVTLRFRHAARAALWSYLRPESNVPPDAVAVSRFGLDPSIGVPIARGAFEDVYPDTHATRLELLAYVWDLSRSSRWIVLTLFGAGLCIFTAVLLLWRALDGGSVPARTACRSAAAFAGALALSGTYAVLVPPFHAADEPNHFLALANYLGRADLSAEATTWARHGHFTEIRFHVDRRFSPLDRAAPGREWGALDMGSSARGTGARALWALAGPAIRGLNAPRALLAMRGIHAFIFAAACGVFVFAVDRLTDARFPELLAIPLFLIPTLPYFGMYMSNYAPLLSCYVVFASGVAVAAWDGPRSHFAGPLMAAGLMAALAISRSALPLVPFAGSVVFARLVLGDREARRGPACVYWGGLTLVTLAGLAAASSVSPDGLTGNLIAARVRTIQLPIAPFLRSPAWLVVPGAALLAFELAVTALRRRLGQVSWNIHTPVRAVCTATAALLLALLVASLWVDDPSLQSIDPKRPVSSWQYVKNAELASLTFLRFGRPDNLTSVTFWGGFGWLETLLPDPLISVLAGASGLALVVLLLSIGRRGSGRAVCWLVCALAGYSLSIGWYALGVHRLGADLHGRYLVGLYLSVLVVAWSGMARMAESDRIPRRGPLMAAAGLCCLMVHSYSIVFLLSRYF